MTVITREQRDKLRWIVGAVSPRGSDPSGIEQIDALFEQGLRDAGIEVERTPEEKIASLVAAVRRLGTNSDGTLRPDGNWLALGAVRTLVREHLGVDLGESP